MAIWERIDRLTRRRVLAWASRAVRRPEAWLRHDRYSRGKVGLRPDGGRIESVIPSAPDAGRPFPKWRGKTPTFDRSGRHKAQPPRHDGPGSARAMPLVSRRSEAAIPRCR